MWSTKSAKSDNLRSLVSRFRISAGDYSVYLDGVSVLTGNHTLAGVADTVFFDDNFFNALANVPLTQITLNEAVPAPAAFALILLAMGAVAGRQLLRR